MNKPYPSSALQTQHLELLRRLARNEPHHIPAWQIADAADIEMRGTHVCVLLDDVIAYAQKCLGDLSAHASPRPNFSDFAPRLFDMVGDLRGALDAAAVRAMVRAMEDAE